jgi:hypothetical protein
MYEPLRANEGMPTETSVEEYYQELLEDLKRIANYWLQRSEIAQQEYQAMYDYGPTPEEVYTYRDALTLIDRVLSRVLSSSEKE